VIEQEKAKVKDLVYKTKGMDSISKAKNLIFIAKIKAWNSVIFAQNKILI